jgi:GNAT superfamily N-acetyltransferase
MAVDLFCHLVIHSSYHKKEGYHLIEYRIAIEADLEQLAAMRWDFRLEESPGTPVHDRATFMMACVAFLTQGLASGAWAYWIARDAGLIVAQIFVQRIAKVPKPNRLDDTFGYVTNVYTRPAYRNQGIGSQLLGHVIAWADEQELENLVVWPSERSIPFYTRAGFRGGSEALELEVRPYVL